MNISDLSDKALTWTLWSTGAAAGAAISHVALRMISSSWFGLPVYAGFSLIGGVVYNRLVREGSSYVLKDITSQRTVTCIFGAFGTVSTAVITTVALRVLCLTPLGWYGLALQAGIAIASGILHTQLTKDWLPSSLHGADDEKIREIVKGADKAQLLEFFKKKLLTVHQTLVFADAFGQRKDVSPKETAEIFDSFKFRYLTPILDLDPDLGLNKVTLLKLCEGDTVSWFPYALRQWKGESICEIVKETEKNKLKKIFPSRCQLLNLDKALLNSERVFAFVDQFGRRDDVSSSEAGEIFRLAENMCSLWVGPQGTFSEVTLGKLLVHFSRNEVFSWQGILLRYTSTDPERQIQILKTFPLRSDSISRDTSRNKDGEFVYPSLAPETIQHLLNNNPTIWDLAICQKQCKDRRFDQWDTVRLEDLQPIIEFFNFNKCVDLATSQKSSYWESSLLKVVVESLSDKQITPFFGLLLEKKSHACLPALRDTLKKRNVTAIEGFNLLPPLIIPFNYDPLYEDDTILSYRLTQQEFLASCSRRDLCSFLHRGISDAAGDHLIEEIQKQDLLPFATIEELTTLSYAFFSDFTSPVRPAFETASISADAIRWLANGDRDYFLWLLQALLQPSPMLYRAGRIPQLLPPGISGQEKERLLEERALFWLAQAVTDPESTKAPDWVTKVVTRSPETFGFVLGHWEAFKHKDQKYGLRLLIKSLQLEEETIKRFGSAYVMEIDNRPREQGRAMLNKIVEYGKTQPLKGNAIIETLASALAFEESCYTVERSGIKNDGPFAQLSKDMFKYLCDLLEPRDLASLASACRELFHRVGAPGALIWKDKKIGSIRVVGWHVRNPSPATSSTDSKNETTPSLEIGGESAPGIPDTSVAALPTIESKNLLIDLPHEVFERVCLFLEAEDLARTAQTCCELFFQICGPQSRVWKQKKLGSTRAIQEMNRLSRSLEGEIREIRHNAYSNIELRRSLFKLHHSLQDALFLAWPAKRLFCLGRVEDAEGGSLVRSIPLLFGRDVDGKSFIMPGQNPLKPIFDKMLAGDFPGIPLALPKVFARFLRDNPIYFTYPRWEVDVAKISPETWELLEQFGLPWNGVEPFCKGIMICVASWEGWNNIPEQLQTHFKKVLKRLQKDYPYFSFESKIPEECLAIRPH